MRAHAEPGRAYHTMAHITHCLLELDRVRGTLPRPDEAELAIWYHDAIYRPGAADNERRSAGLADQVLAEAGLPGDARERIATMILATAHHDLAPDPDTAAVVDADLSILGAPEPDFDAYEAAIRREYAMVPETEFRARRSEILRQLLDRPAIYATPLFHRLHEAAARANLTRSLRQLAIDPPSPPR